MKIKKIACLLMAFAMIWMTASCRVSDGSVTELTDPTGSQQTTPADPGSDGPSKPITTDPSEPDVSEPDVSEPTVPDVSEPADPVNPTDPSEPSEPVDPAEPSEPDVPVHQHSYVEDVTKATCTKDGYTTYTCACGDSYVDGKIEATGHSWSDWVTIEEPTVTATGMAGRNCTACGEAETKVLDKVIPDHTHSYTGKVTTAATCTKEGVKTFTCSCGSSYTESIAKASHSYKATITVPTCTAKGYTTHKCSACNDSYRDTYVAATGHSYGTYKADGNATCTKDGTKTAKCSTCSVTNTVTDTGSATGHSYGSYTSNGNATCTADGTKTATCSACGVKDTKTDTGTAKGHSYAASVTAPTCTAQGYTLHKCSACGDSYKDSYTPTIDHSYVVTEIDEASFWYEGHTVYSCSVCANSYTEYYGITQEEYDQFIQDIAAATLKYINQFRVEQGDTEAISLPGLTLIAEYRAVQLQDNFAHSTADLREAYAYYQYGEWHDNTAYGGTQYWSANAKEAIGRGMWSHMTADQIGYEMAVCFRNSNNHWAYVGSSEYPYIAVGFSYGRGWFNCCVLQTRKNYG